MIWDTFLFRNELDMLELRLSEFDEYGLPVQHILVEAMQDFHGRDKPLIFAANEARFSRWREQIHHVVVPQLPDAENPWVREHAQRDAMCPTLEKLASDEDLVLICDGDEIPSFEACHYRGVPASLLMRTCHSAVDWLYPAEQPGSVLSSMHYLRGRKLSAVRDSRDGLNWVAGGGWHLSWLGGPEVQQQKLKVTCHLELAEHEKQILASGAGYRDGVHVGVTMVPAEVNGSWPKYVRERKCPENWFRPR